MTETPPRLYVESNLSPAADVPASEAQAHYLLNVMRRRSGEAVTLFNGRDGEWSATIAQHGKKNATFAINAQLRVQDTAPRVTLLFAPLKSQRLEILIEKATELGVGDLVPVITQRTIATKVNLARLCANAIEAAEQCERLTVPTVAEPQNLDGALAAWARDRAGAPLFFLDEVAAREGTATPLPEALRGVTGAAGFLIGPEGGFTIDEHDRLRGAVPVTAVTLGPRILRAETAAFAALACWQAVCGDWRGQKP
jgi:16S rRNA (uracil1498-N3)-methyltransferase